VGFSESKLREKLEKWDERDRDLRNSKHMTGCLYAREDEAGMDLIREFSKRYLYANPLHFEIFPSAMQMEAELISMTAKLFNGNEDACGIVTSGGTESLLLACLAYRNLARERGIKEPELIMPETVHAAVNKACWYFNIRCVIVPYDQDTGKVYTKKLLNAINKNTCMVVVSYPNYANGNCDDIETISKECAKRNVPVHVDCCLGGMLAVFAERCEVKTPPFDFRLKGVTSISCDHHKYGLAPKGVSVILFRHSQYRTHCMFAITTWPGGIYATPGISGSRGGAASAGAWVAMVHFGAVGLKERAQQIFKAQAELLQKLKEIPEVKVIGNPQLGTIAFKSARKTFSIYAVHDFMVQKGWHINAMQKPAAIQVLLNYNNVQFIKEFIKDLKAGIEKVGKDPASGADNKWAKLYASVAKLPSELVEEGSKIALESFLKL
jgi:sphinganine-1-phosphate aldolase